jgi:hypothetical protein
VRKTPVWLSHTQQSICSAQRKIRGQIGSRSTCFDRSRPYCLSPAEPPGREQEPGQRIRLDDVGRSPSRVARPGDALHRRDRYHSHFHGTSRGVSLKYLQQVPRRSPQPRLRRFLAVVDGCPDLGNPCWAFGVGPPGWHVCDGTCQCGLGVFPAAVGA